MNRREQDRKQEEQGTPQKRRTQSERSARTREKVLKATIDCIVEEGFPNTTAARIATRSGMTWGAIVHQFGDKESVLLAVVERSFENLSKSLLESTAENAFSARDRLSLLIDETWRRFQDPTARAFLEIILSSRNLADGSLRARQEGLIVSLSQQLWAELFDDDDIDPQRLDTVRKLTFATLLGLSIQAMIGPQQPRFSRELALLKENVIRMLVLNESQ